MTVTCFIRYELDPFQCEAFREYAEAWGRIIPRCGGNLVGYFLPNEGTNDIAWGLISFASLAAYEAYRARLREDPESLANFAFARERRFILGEERSVLADVAAWRSDEPHRAAQKMGRAGLFAGYRLRVAAVLRDYGLSGREEAPADSRAVHAPMAR